MDLVEDLKTYTQKSTMFLWPMLALPTNIKPISTYLVIEGVDFKIPMLFALFAKNTPNFANIKKEMMKHEQFEYLIGDGDFEIFMFNFSNKEQDFLYVINGKYSHLSQSSKVKIISTSKSKLTEIGLYPSNYYDLYKEELEIEFNEKEGPELLDLPDFNCNERLHVSERTKGYISKIAFSLS